MAPLLDRIADLPPIPFAAVVLPLALSPILGAAVVLAAIMTAVR